jgi:hypothetical protein
MSALGQKRTSLRQCLLCAKSGLTRCSNFLLLFDLSVGAANQRKRFASMERWKNFYRQELQV